MEVGDWIIYYGDGSTFSYKDGSPFDAPGTDVQVIGVMREDGNIRPTWGSDCYRWEGEKWVGCNWMDLPQYYIKYKGPQKVILGYEMRRKEDCTKILERAIREGIK